MGKSSGSQPAAPDPKDTARVQAGVDFKTTRANVIMGNSNQITPDGTSLWSQTYQTLGDEQVPVSTNTVTLSPTNQAIYNQHKAAELGLANLANTQTGKITQLLGSPTDTTTLPARAGTVSAPGLTASAINPTFSVGNFGAVAAGDPITKTVSQQNASGNIANSGAIQTALPNSDYAAQRAAVEDAIYSRLNPQLEQDRLALENKLVNQGFQRGSAGFTQQMDEYNRQANDARMQAVLAGGQEQSRLAGLANMSGQFANSAQQQQFNQNIGATQLANQAAQQNNAANIATGNFANTAQQQGFSQAAERTLANNQIQQDIHNAYNDIRQKDFLNQQSVREFQNKNAMDLYNVGMQNAAFQNNNRSAALEEQLRLRNQPINEITALLSGSQVQMPQSQQFNFTPMNSPNVMQAAYNTAALNNQNYQTQQSQQNAMMGGLFGLGSAGIYGGLMRSDRRLKRDIADIGVKLRNGLKLYVYRYAWEAKRRVGVMADEVARVVPGAVGTIDGFLAVDYGRVMRAA